jgi:hypothetical protein
VLAEVFPADAPRPELAERLGVFAPLIGSGDLVVEDVAPDGAVEVSDGEWGLSLRFWDEALGAYRSTWHGPLRGWVIPFRALPTGDGLVLEGVRDGTGLRWIFSEVTAVSFRWRAEEAEDGAPFRVRQRFAATRRQS